MKLRLTALAPKDNKGPSGAVVLIPGERETVSVVRGTIRRPNQ